MADDHAPTMHSAVLKSSAALVAHLVEEVSQHEQDMLRHAAIKPLGAAQTETAVVVMIVACLSVLTLSVAFLLCAMLDKPKTPSGGAKPASGDVLNPFAPSTRRTKPAVYRLPRKLNDVLELHRAEGWLALAHFISRASLADDERRALFSQLPRVIAKVFGLEGHGWQADVQTSEDRHALLDLIMPPLPAAPAPATAAAERGSPAAGAATPASRTPASSTRPGALGLEQTASRTARTPASTPAMPTAAAGSLFEQIFAARALADGRGGHLYAFFVRKLPAPLLAPIERRQWHCLPPLIRLKLEQAAALLPHTAPTPGGAQGGAPLTPGGGGYGGAGAGAGAGRYGADAAAAQPGAPAGGADGLGAVGSGLAASEASKPDVSSAPPAQAVPTELTLSCSEYALFLICAAATENASAFYTEALYDAPYSAYPLDAPPGQPAARAAPSPEPHAAHGGATAAALRRRRPLCLYVQLLRAYLDYFLPTPQSVAADGVLEAVASPSAGTPRRAALTPGERLGGGGGGGAATSAAAAAEADPASIRARRELHDLFLAVVVAFWLHAGVADERRYTAVGAPLDASAGLPGATYAEPPIQLIQCVELLVDHVAGGLRAGVRAHAAARAARGGAGGQPLALGQGLYQLGIGRAVAGLAAAAGGGGGGGPALGGGVLSPYEQLSDRVYHFVLAALLKLPPGSRRYPRVVSLWLAYALPFHGFCAAKDLAGGVGGEANRPLGAVTDVLALAGGRAPPNPHAHALQGLCGGHWREFVAGHWLLIAKGLVAVLDDSRGQLELGSADSLALLGAVLAPLSCHSELLPVLVALADAVLSRAVGAPPPPQQPAGGGGGVSVSAYEVELAVKFAYHFEGVGWPAVAQAVRPVALRASLERLLARLERKSDELTAEQRALRGSMAGQFESALETLGGGRRAGVPPTSLLAQLEALQAQLGALLDSLSPGGAAGARVRSAASARPPGADAAAAAARGLNRLGEREPHSGALTPAGRQLLARGGARADPASIAFRATPTTPRRPIARGELGLLVRGAEAASALLRGPALAWLSRSLAAPLAARAALLIDAVSLRGLASTRVVGACTVLCALASARAPAGSSASLRHGWRAVLVLLLVVVGLLVRKAALGPARTDARAWVDPHSWAQWARAELLRGSSAREVEGRLVDELAPLVGATAAETVAAQVLARACAEVDGAVAQQQPRADRSTPQVARRMAFF